MMLILLYQMIVYRIMGSANVKYSKFVLTLLLIWVFPIIQKEFPPINYKLTKVPRVVNSCKIWWLEVISARAVGYNILLSYQYNW